MEGITPVAGVTWTDLNKPDKYKYYTITVGLEPKTNAEHAKFLTQLKGMCAEKLTAPDAKLPWFQSKDNPDVYRLRFSTKYEVKEWRDAEDKEIPKPRQVNKGTQVRVKFKAEASNNGKFLNLYLNGVQIVSVPSSSGADDKKPEWEDPLEDLPF
jgi:hypothetical protein